MKLHDQRILLTGASGGIGQALARELARQGARLGLLGLDAEALKQLAAELVETGAEATVIPVDITRAEQREQALRDMRQAFGGTDILINSAGVTDFTGFAGQDPGSIDRILQINVTAAVQLTRALLPDLMAQGHGQIVNLGSIFGSIAFPYFAVYSASKFALRGFSEALRRELQGTGVGVTYVAPRAVRTPLNSQAVYQMAEAVKMNLDEPEAVARRLVRALEARSKDVYLGFPESLFVRINGLLPRLVDGALRKQAEIMRRFA